MTQTALGERYKIGDVVLQELPNFQSRRLCQIDKSQTLKLGQVLAGDPFNGLLSAIAADSTAAAVNEVRNLVFVNSDSDVGTFKIIIEGVATGAITAATYAQQITNIQTACDAAYGTNAVVCTSSGSLATIVLTFSGGAFAGRPIGSVITNVIGHATGSSLTINGGGTVGVDVPAPVKVAGSMAGGGTDQLETYNITGTIGVTSVLGLRIQQPNGQYITVSALCTTNAAGWVSRINTAITAAFGSGVGPVVGGSAYTSLTITYSGTAYTKRPVTEDVGFDFSGTFNAAAGDVTYTYTKTITTQGTRPTNEALASCILLEDVTTTATQYKQALCLVRLAMVKAGFLSYGSNITTAAQKAAVVADLASHGIEIRPTPTYNATPDANLTETVTTGTGLQGM